MNRYALILGAAILLLCSCNLAGLHNVTTTVVAINGSAVSPNTGKFPVPQACTVALLRIEGTGTAYDGRYYEIRVEEAGWAYNHRVGDKVTVDFIPTQKVFEIKPR